MNFRDSILWILNKMHVSKYYNEFIKGIYERAVTNMGITHGEAYEFKVTIGL